MDPQTLPLEPLIAPPAVSWWPLAPIWWLSIILVIIAVIGLLIFTIRQRFTSNKPTTLPIITIDAKRQAALAELKSLKKPYKIPTGLWLQQINALLKRLCISHYPNESINLLTGQIWLNFLNNKCPEAGLRGFPMLVENPYQPDYYMNDTTIDNLYSSIEMWITHYV